MYQQDTTIRQGVIQSDFLYIYTNWQSIFARVLMSCISEILCILRDLIFMIGPICFSHWEGINYVSLVAFI